MVEINEYRKELKSRIIDYAMGEFYKRGVRAVKMDEISQGLLCLSVPYMKYSVIKRNCSLLD